MKTYGYRVWVTFVNNSVVMSEDVDIDFAETRTYAHQRALSIIRSNFPNAKHVVVMDSKKF